MNIWLQPDFASSWENAGSNIPNTRKTMNQTGPNWAAGTAKFRITSGA